jgi:hypothetical protein
VWRVAALEFLNVPQKQTDWICPRKAFSRHVKWPFAIVIESNQSVHRDHVLRTRTLQLQPVSSNQAVEGEFQSSRFELRKHSNRAKRSRSSVGHE